MPLLRQPKYSHLLHVVRHYGLNITKALFLKKVQDITPVSHDPFPWTVDDFLNENRGKINHKRCLNELFAKPINVDEWGINTYCLLLIMCCKLEGKLKQDIYDLKTIWNNQFGEGDINNQMYLICLGMIQGIVDRCSEALVDPAKTLKDVVKEIEAVETTDIGEEEKLRVCYTDEITRQDDEVEEKDEKLENIPGKSIDISTDISSWRKCIEQKNKTLGFKLLKSGKLPRRQETIDEIYSVFQEENDLIFQVCDDICKKIVKASKGVTHVWAAYTLKNKANVTFVIHTDINNKIECGGYRYIHRVNNELSSEGKDVLADPIYLETKLTNEERETIRRCINGNRKELMKNHKHLSIITVSPVRSRNYKPSCPKLIPEACICLYVPVKGYIPIDELPFEASYNNIRTDVREGIFTPYMYSQEDKENCLRFGCQIENSPSSETPQSGALCGFIEHPRYGTCGITSAHVLLHSGIFEKLKREGEMVRQSFSENSSLGHVYCGQIQIGDIVRCLYCKGDEIDQAGYEVALFKITSGRPKTGQFYGDERDTYNSGLTYDYLWMADSPLVFKFGWKTKKTEAQFDVDGTSVSVRTANVDAEKNLSFELHGQLLVTSGTFADKGDSGAPVFTRRHDGEIACVGMVTGGASYGATVVTPIGPLLNALNVSGLKNFEQSNLADKLDRIEGKLEKLVQFLMNGKGEQKEDRDSDIRPRHTSDEESTTNSDIENVIYKRKANSPNLSRKKKKE